MISVPKFLGVVIGYWAGKVFHAYLVEAPDIWAVAQSEGVEFLVLSAVVLLYAEPVK